MKPSCNPCNQECRQGRDCPEHLARIREMRLREGGWVGQKPVAMLKTLRAVFRSAKASPERPVG